MVNFSQRSLKLISITCLAIGPLVAYSTNQGCASQFLGASPSSESSGQKALVNSDMSKPPSQASPSNAISRADEPGLIFRSGFEAESKVILKHGRVMDIRGTDNSVSPPNNWTQDLQASGRTFGMNYVDHDKGGLNPEILGAKLVEDPEGGRNKVLYTWQKDAEKQDEGPFSRVQGEFNRLNWKEFYYKVRFRLGNDIASVNSSKNGPFLLSLVEFFTGSAGNHKLARIILHKSEGAGPLKWRSEILNFTGVGHTLFKGSNVQPQYDQWQTLEFYLKSGDASTGRYWVRLNESQVLFDETLETTYPAATKDIQKSSILKSYGGPLVKEVKRKGGKVEVWFDDVEIWNSLPPDLVGIVSPASGLISSE